MSHIPLVFHHGCMCTFKLQIQQLSEADHWLSQQFEIWECRLDGLAQYLRTLEKNEP